MNFGLHHVSQDSHQTDYPFITSNFGQSATLMQDSKIHSAVSAAIRANMRVLPEETERDGRVIINE
ncbi:MAG: hypothetical protein HOA17_09170 [Candidatus Melainabacteria bacterium]|jgi:hypothetical protein|nr:hypothetical protein [Candidatus Melainabacteria bacterium]